MIARRLALASLIAATASFAVTGCGMMGDRDKGMGGTMTIPLSGQNEVPPNASPASISKLIRSGSDGWVGVWT